MYIIDFRYPLAEKYINRHRKIWKAHILFSENTVTSTSKLCYGAKYLTTCILIDISIEFSLVPTYF